MDRQIRRLGIAFVALFAVLFAQVAYVQVVAADRIASEPANAPRQIRAEYAVERGQILAAEPHDRARQVAPRTPTPNSPYSFLRQYPRRRALRPAHRLLLADLRAQRPRAGDEPLPRRAPRRSSPPRTSPTSSSGGPKRGGTCITTLVPQRAAEAREGARHLRGRGRRDRPGDRRHPRDVLEPGLRPAPACPPAPTRRSRRRGQADLRPDDTARRRTRSRTSTCRARRSRRSPRAPRSTTAGRPRRPGRTRTTSSCPARPRTSRTSATSSAPAVATTVTMEQAFTSSCNVPFAEIGMALGADKMAAQAQAYGLCQIDPVTGQHRRSAKTTRSRSCCRGRSGRFPVASYFDNNEAALARSSIGLDNDLLNPLHLGADRRRDRERAARCTSRVS